MKQLKNLKFRFLLLLSLVLSAVGCNKEEINFDTPFVKLSQQNVTAPKEGGSVTFTVESNRPWTVQVSVAGTENWIAVEPAKGEGNGEVKLTLLPNQGVDREATIKIATPTVYEYVKVKQTGAIQTTQLYAINFGTSAPSASPWAYPDTYTDWGHSGPGVTASITFTGEGASLRTPSKASSEYAGASGGASVFFGAGQAGNAHFEINKIATGGNQNFVITFGATRYLMNAPDANVFYPEKMLLSVSTNGTSWAPVSYTFVSGQIWGQATANVSIPAGSEFMYLKFETTEASTMRLDDIVVKSTNAPVSNVTVFTAAASNLAETSATVAGSFTAPLTMQVTEAGVEYKTGAGAYTKVAASSITLNAFTVNLVNLTKSTTYTYRAYAKTATQTYYGSEMNFTTTAGVQKTYITVSELRAKGETTITEDLFMKAVMISDQTGANSTSLKNIVVSDNGAGVAVRLTANAATMAVGTELEFNLKNAVLSKYNGLLQLNNFANANMTPTGETKTINAVPITAAQLLTGNYESMYVAVSNVQVVNADLSKTVGGAAHTSINMESNNSESFVMFTASYAAFKTDNVPQGSGVLKGIASVNNSVYQVMPRAASDYAGMTNARFGAPAQLTIGTVSVSGTMKVGTALTGLTNFVSIPFTNATPGSAFSYAVDISGAGAGGFTTPRTFTGSFGLANGTIVISLAGTPTTAGAVTFMITGTGITGSLTVNGTVEAAGTPQTTTYLSENFAAFTGGGLGLVPTPGVAFVSNASYPSVTDFAAAGLTGWAGENASKAEGAMKFGTSSKLGTLTTPALTAIGATATDVTLTFKAANWETAGKNLVVSIAEGTGTITNGTVALPGRVDTVTGMVEYTVQITGATSTTKIKIAAELAASNRFFLDDIVVKSKN